MKQFITWTVNTAPAPFQTKGSVNMLVQFMLLLWTQILYKILQ